MQKKNILSPSNHFLIDFHSQPKVAFRCIFPRRFGDARRTMLSVVSMMCVGVYPDLRSQTLDPGLGTIDVVQCFQAEAECTSITENM